MNIALWIVAGLLAIVAAVGGVTKAFVPKQRLASSRGGEWTATVDGRLVKALGVLEMLAAVGLILPGAINIAPLVVAVTALCWVALMIGAMITHGRLGQHRLIALNFLYLAMAAFVAWGRLGPVPF